MHCVGANSGTGRINAAGGCWGASHHLLGGGAVDPEDDGHDLAGRGGEHQQQRDCRQLLALLLRGGGSRRPKRKLSGGARSQHGQAQHAGREEDPGGTQPIGQQQSCDDEAVEGIQTVAASANTPNASVNAANEMEGKVAQKKNANKRYVAKSLPLISHFSSALHPRKCFPCCPLHAQKPLGEEFLTPILRRYYKICDHADGCHKIATVICGRPASPPAAPHLKPAAHETFHDDPNPRSRDQGMHLELIFTASLSSLFSLSLFFFSLSHAVWRCQAACCSAVQRAQARVPHRRPQPRVLQMFQESNFWGARARCSTS